MLVERWYTNTPKETCVMIELDSCLSICFYFIHFFSTQFRMIGSFSRIIINGVDFFLLKWQHIDDPLAPLLKTTFSRSIPNGADRNSLNRRRALDEERKGHSFHVHASTIKMGGVGKLVGDSLTSVTASRQISLFLFLCY